LSLDTETESLYNARLTISDHLSQILPRILSDETSEMPMWPADVFAIAASLLQRTGAYARAMDHWPPDGRESTWIDEVREAGKHWRQHWKDGSFTYLEQSWNVLLAKRSMGLDEIFADTDLLQALIELCAVADETSNQLGIFDKDGSSEPETEEEQDFDFQADSLLEESSSLCYEIHPSRLRVLPKMHTPQTGLTIRSFSLNLALVTTGEITPTWHIYPYLLGEKSIRILFVPWPRKVDADDIRPAPHLAREMRNMPSHFDFFEYEPSAPEDPVSYVDDLLKRVEKSGSSVDAILLPELALSDSEFESLRTILVEQNKVLIAGVRTPHADGVRCKNEARFAIPFYDTVAQAKHHRWKLDRGQIEQYSLTQLSPDKIWWEHIDLSSRECMFVSLGKGGVISVLICEDLARPDPVGDLIRAVAPNLVIALLMDGPQLKNRWPARYAASLANDPGSSVLSVTSIGMSSRSKPKDPKDDKSRVVGLWHSADGDFRELELPPGNDALILTLERTYEHEWTADGRDNNANAGIIRLTNCQAYPGT
jgi:predicted amidohydrolase